MHTKLKAQVEQNRRDDEAQDKMLTSHMASTNT